MRDAARSALSRCDGLLDGPSRARGPRLMIGLASAIAAAVSALIKRATAADTF